MRFAPFHSHPTANGIHKLVQTVTYAAQSSQFARIFIFITKQSTTTRLSSRQSNAQLIQYLIIRFIEIGSSATQLFFRNKSKTKKKCQVRSFFLIDDRHCYYTFVNVLEFLHFAISIVFKFILPTMQVFFTAFFPLCALFVHIFTFADVRSHSSFGV